MIKTFDLKSRWKLFSALLIVLILLFVGYRWFFGPATASEETLYLYIDNDDTTDSVAVKVGNIGGRPANWGFRIMAKLTSYEARTGRYAVDPGMNVMALFRQLRNGSQTPVRLIVPSVRTMDKLAGVLGKKLMADSTSLAQAFSDSAFCRKYGYDTATIACLIIPNTYEIYWDVSIDQFMKRMEKENEAFWNEERQQKAQNAGLTRNEVYTLASIVDEETNNNGEKPMVAGMYINRLRRGIPLQADPTVKFALKDFGLRRIYNTHLKTESPYNTYINIGLPPGPIRVASVAGIDAVLNYTPHDYIYMCAKEDFSGTHNFAATYAEHLRNAAKYRKALNKRGIK